MNSLRGAFFGIFRVYSAFSHEKTQVFFDRGLAALLYAIAVRHSVQHAYYTLCTTVISPCSRVDTNGGHERRYVFLNGQFRGRYTGNKSLHSNSLIHAFEHRVLESCVETTNIIHLSLYHIYKSRNHRYVRFRNSAGQRLNLNRRLSILLNCI